MPHPGTGKSVLRPTTLGHCSTALCYEPAKWVVAHDGATEYPDTVQRLCDECAVSTVRSIPDSLLAKAGLTRMPPEDPAHREHVEAYRAYLHTLPPDSPERRLAEVAAEHGAAHADVLAEQMAAARAETADTGQYPCKACGKPFDTPQQLRGHKLRCPKASKGGDNADG